MNSFFENIKSFYAFLMKHRYCLQEDSVEKGVRFLATCTDAFRAEHTPFFLAKILNAFCNFERRIQEAHDLSFQRRKILFRLFNVSARERSALGLAVVLKLKEYTEYLNRENLLRAVLHVLPGVEAIAHRSYQFRDEANGILFLYQEIEKKRGRGFSRADVQKLKQSLGKELEESIEFYSPSLFLVRNEEEIFRNIVYMGKELTKADDIPQVTISFQEQTAKGILRFSVVVVRLVTSETPTLKQLSEDLPTTISFIQEMCSEIGNVEKKWTKEANITTFEVGGNNFAKKNGSIDLREARSYIAKVLELMIGEYRDYNGGLFSKQNKHLKEIQENLGEANRMFLDSLFYAFTPSLFQTFILPEAGKACAALFLEAKNAQLTAQNNTAIYKSQDSTYLLMVVKTGSEQIKNSIMREVANYSLPLHQFGSTMQCIQGEYYLGLIYQYPTNPHLFDSVESLFQATEQREGRKKCLRINFLEGDPLSLNPHLGLDLRCRALQKALLEGLTRISPTGTIQLAAAKSVEILENGKTYLFTLRKTQWSNGEDVTAFHFERCWKKAILSTSCLRPDLFYIIQSARKASQRLASSEEIGVEAVDKYTLKVTLEYSAPYFLEMLAHPIFFPLYEESGEPYVFNGPFTLQSWHRNTALILAKNPYYWDFENIQLDGIEISMIRDPSQAFEHYKKGQLDWIGGPFSLLPLPLAGQVLDQMQRVDTPGVLWLYCNLNHPLFSSAKIRRAMNLALDRKKICEKEILSPIPLYSPLPRGLSQLTESLTDLNDEDPSLLFAQGLEELNSSARALESIKLFHSDIPGQLEVAEELQTQWATALGLRIERIEKTWNTFSHKLDNRLIHLGSCYRHPFYYDPMYFFHIFNDPNNIHNPFGWQSELFDHWVAQARSFPQEKTYLKLAETELIQQMPIIPIHMVSYHYLARSEVKGIHFCHSGDVDLRWIYFEGGQ